MFPASRPRAPVAPDRATHSEPAKSTRFSCPYRICSTPSRVISLIIIFRVKMEWERLEALFICVSATWRWLMPLCSASRASLGLVATTSVRLLHTTPLVLSHSMSFLVLLSLPPAAWFWLDLPIIDVLGAE